MMPTALSAATQRRARISRDGRVANFRRLIDELAHGDMTLSQMCAFLGVSGPNGKRYCSALVLQRVVRRLNYRAGGHRNAAIFTLVADQARIDAFLAYIDGCSCVEHEIGQNKRRQGDTADTEFDYCMQVRVQAKQIGMARPWYIACLFGEAQQVPA